MSLIAGIDFSTHSIDVVLIDENAQKAPQWLHCELAGDDSFERARELSLPRADNLSLPIDDVLAIGIEQPQARGPRAANLHVLYRTQGAILARIPRSTLVVPLLPSEWRAAVGLPGNCKKVDVGVHVRRELTERWPGARHWTQDACDAYCIAKATLNALERSQAA